MRSIVTLVVFAATLTIPACQTPVESNAERAGEVRTSVLRRVIAFQHQDARIVANHARAGFSCPPMEANVQVECDAKNNSWIVRATAADMARVEQIAARYDQPGEAPWKKGQ